MAGMSGIQPANSARSLAEILLVLSKIIKGARCACLFAVVKTNWGDGWPFVILRNVLLAAHMYPNAFPAVRSNLYTQARRLTRIPTPLAWLICPNSGAKADL